MKVIYVDDEIASLDNFRMTVNGLSMVEELNLFQKSEEALKWVEGHSVDVAFLDIQMPGINGIELAKGLKAIDRNIRIVFVTAYEQYALEAFRVDAIGYLLKPYFGEDVEKELEKASYIR
ncbi:MAG: LytR/AlgR family response regulator transcription factor [Roseburia sp.]